MCIRDRFYTGVNQSGEDVYNDVQEEIEVTSVTTGWRTFNNYLTIGGGFTSRAGWECVGTISGGVLDLGGSNWGAGSNESSKQYWPEHGPIPWRANVKMTDGGSSYTQYSLGGLYVDAQGLGGGCLYATQPQLWAGNGTYGSYWSIEGKWEFSNDNNTVLATWEGRRSSDDGFNSGQHGGPSS